MGSTDSEADASVRKVSSSGHWLEAHSGFHDGTDWIGDPFQFPLKFWYKQWTGFINWIANDQIQLSNIRLWNLFSGLSKDSSTFILVNMMGPVEPEIYFHQNLV